MICTPLRLLAIAVAMAAANAAGAQENLLTTSANWEAHSFAGETRYTWLRDSDGEYVCGDANGTASLQHRRIPVDLEETPLLSWRWRVPRTLPDLDQQTRKGDDFPTRMYVVAQKGIGLRTLVYIWAHSPADKPWANPFDRNTIMVPLRHGPGGKWQRESVNVRADLARHFNLDEPTELGIGFMTDGDNSGEHLSGCYRDLIFSSDGSGQEGG